MEDIVGVKGVTVPGWVTFSACRIKGKGQACLLSALTHTLKQTFFTIPVGVTHRYYAFHGPQFNPNQQLILTFILNPNINSEK